MVLARIRLLVPGVWVMVELLQDGKAPPLVLTEEDSVLVDWENELEAQFKAWGHRFLAWARDCGAVVHEQGLDYYISLDRLAQSLLAMDGRKKMAEKHKALLAKFWVLADRSGAYMAGYDVEAKMLRLSKPGSEWAERDVGA